METYEAYLKEPKSLKIEEMEALSGRLLAAVKGDEDAVELYEELLKTAVRYAGIRAGWLLMSREERMERDSGRTACHNSLIVKCNQLAVYLNGIGRDSSWREDLGYEEDDPYNRKRIGDFGCYLAFLSALDAR